MTLTDLERAVLEAITDSHPDLRAQLDGLGVCDREMTGVGFFTKFRVAPSAHSLPSPSRLALGAHVSAETSALERGIGFVLFVEDGRLALLEAFTYDEPWPDEIERFTIVREK